MKTIKESFNILDLSDIELIAIKHLIEERLKETYTQIDKNNKSELLRESMQVYKSIKSKLNNVW